MRYSQFSLSLLLVATLIDGASGTHRQYTRRSLRGLEVTAFHPYRSDSTRILSHKSGGSGSLMSANGTASTGRSSSSEYIENDLLTGEDWRSDRNHTLTGKDGRSGGNRAPTGKGSHSGDRNHTLSSEEDRQRETGKSEGRGGGKGSRLGNHPRTNGSKGDGSRRGSSGTEGEGDGGGWNEPTNEDY